MCFNPTSWNHLCHLAVSSLVLIVTGGFFLFAIESAGTITMVEELQSELLIVRLGEEEEEEEILDMEVLNTMLKSAGDQSIMDSLTVSMTQELKISMTALYVSGVDEEKVKRSPEFRNEVRHKARYAEWKCMLMALILFFLLATLRGWQRLKRSLKELTPEQVQKYHLSKHAEDTIIYRGATNFAYRLFKKRLVLDPIYFLNHRREDVRVFILEHEGAHLRYFDAVIRNLQINLKSPIFLLLLTVIFFGVLAQLTLLAPQMMPDGVYFSSVTMRADPSVFQHLPVEMQIPLTDQDTLGLIGFSIFVIIIAVKAILLLGVLYYAYCRLVFWFSLIKEYLADEYATLRTGEGIPDIALPSSRYHPPESDRRRFVLGGRVSLNIYPIALCVLLLVNMISCYITSSWFFNLLVISGLLSFFVCDLYKLRACMLTSKQLILLLSIAGVCIFLDYCLCDIIYELNPSNANMMITYFVSSGSTIAVCCVFILWFFISRKRIDG